VYRGQRSFCGRAHGEGGAQTLGALGLCLHAARISEICPLRAEDIKQIEGSWCIAFAAEAGSLKDVNSERVVPLSLGHGGRRFSVVRGLYPQRRIVRGSRARPVWKSRRNGNENIEQVDQVAGRDGQAYFTEPFLAASTENTRPPQRARSRHSRCNDGPWPQDGGRYVWGVPPEAMLRELSKIPAVGL